MVIQIYCDTVVVENKNYVIKLIIRWELNKWIDWNYDFDEAY